MDWFAFHRKSYKQAMLPTCAAIQNSTPCWQISCNCFSFASPMMWSPLPLNSSLPFLPNNRHADHFGHLTSPAPFAAMSKMTLIKIIKIQGITWDFLEAVGVPCLESCMAPLLPQILETPFWSSPFSDDVWNVCYEKLLNYRECIWGDRDYSIVLYCIAV